MKLLIMNEVCSLTGNTHRLMPVLCCLWLPSLSKRYTFALALIQYFRNEVCCMLLIVHITVIFCSCGRARFAYRKREITMLYNADLESLV